MCDVDVLKLDSQCSRASRPQELLFYCILLFGCAFATHATVRLDFKSVNL